MGVGVVAFVLVLRILLCTGRSLATQVGCAVGALGRRAFEARGVAMSRFNAFIVVSRAVGLRLPEPLGKIAGAGSGRV